MRIIEREMNKAIVDRANWKKDNTEVVYSQVRDSSEVYLYGKLICIIAENSIQIFDGGKQSKTTKNRLNAILQENGAGGEKVYSKGGTWMVQINEPFQVDYKVVPFTNGMMVE